MRKIAPGYNEAGWTGQVQCTKSRASIAVGLDGKGCGAMIEVTKADLYIVTAQDIMGSRKEVRFICFCGAENIMPLGELFTNLPNHKEWLASNKTA